MVSQPTPERSSTSLTGHLAGGNESLEFFNHTHDCLKVMAPRTRAPVYEYPALIAEWLRHNAAISPSPRLHLAHHHFPPLSADSIEQSRLSPPAGLHNFHRLDSFKTVESLRIATASGEIAESADGPGVTPKMDGAFKLDGVRVQAGGLCCVVSVRCSSLSKKK